MNYVFLGDSITCGDRLWDPGESGLGNGYVSMLAESICRRDPGAQIRNKGYDGFTLPFLLRNLEDDCLSARPDLVSILIGINDVGVCMNTGRTLEEQEFGQNYRTLLGRIAGETSSKILCLGPFVFPWPRELAGWIPKVREAERYIALAAQEYGALYLPCQDFLNETCEKVGFSEITVDGIHLTEKGHRLLAERILGLHIDKGGKSYVGKKGSIF